LKMKIYFAVYLEDGLMKASIDVPLYRLTEDFIF